MATITETVRRPQVRQTQCFIGGKWVPSASGKTFETIHPATEEVICEVAEGDKEDVDAAVDAARDAFENGPWATMDALDPLQIVLEDPGTFFSNPSFDTASPWQYLYQSSPLP